ncbi:MAG: rRNA adenine dimethyltransferase family protein, partial [Planctomycetota bacterium]|nr:rRNA adenine dimethyltransferase family protein [Planctomycetota bacterium]
MLEIGAGPGQLTEQLAGSAGRVWAVEIDKRLADICARHVQAFEKVDVICADILAERRELNRSVVDRITAEGPGAIKVVSNLPYSIAATVLVNLLESGLPVSVITVLTQYEMAERLIAAPGTRRYGQLSIIVGALADVRVVRKAPPDLFWPRPAVNSALITIRPVRAEFAQTKRYQDLKRAVHRLF